jgi:hypothetical protein
MPLDVFYNFFERSFLHTAFFLKIANTIVILLLQLNVFNILLNNTKCI